MLCIGALLSGERHTLNSRVIGRYSEAPALSSMRSCSRTQKSNQTLTALESLNSNRPTTKGGRHPECVQCRQQHAHVSLQRRNHDGLKRLQFRDDMIYVQNIPGRDLDLSPQFWLDSDEDLKTTMPLLFKHHGVVRSGTTEFRFQKDDCLVALCKNWIR